MTHHKEKASDPEGNGAEEKRVHIEPSERETAKTGDPGRTPGKAEGEDDESATK